MTRRAFLLVASAALAGCATPPWAARESREVPNAAPPASPPPATPTAALPTVAAVAVTAVPTLPPTPTPTLTSALHDPTPTPPPLPAARTLDVPIYGQEHALSCEAAALRMALGTLGTHVTEGEILARLPRDRTPRRVLRDGSVVWGDPDVGFVGAWDGVYLRDGYGVYDGPIAEVARSLGLGGTTHTSGADPETLYTAIRQGFPVVVWVPYGLRVRGRGAWTTAEGKRVPYVVTEHAVVLAGVDDHGVFYADPLQPTLQPATYAAFEAAFAEIDQRAVVVRP